MKKFLSLTLLLILTVTLLLTGCRGQKQVQSIEITEGLKTEYTIGDTPDFSGVKAIVTYNDGSTENVEASQLTFGTIDTSTAGKKSLTVSYKDFSTSFEVVVNDKAIGTNRAINAIIDLAHQLAVDSAYPLYTIHTLGDKNVAKLEAKLAEQGYIVSEREQLGPVVGSHVGPEAFGIIFVAKNPDQIPM